MSDSDFDDIDETGGIANLRKAYKKQKDELAEMRSQLAALSSANARNELDTVFRLRGVDPEVSKFYPKDRPTTAESVEEWIEENAKFFGAPENAPGPAASSLSPIEQEGYSIISKIQAAEAATHADFVGRLQKATNEAEVKAVMAEFGAQHTF